MIVNQRDHHRLSYINFKMKIIYETIPNVYEHIVDEEFGECMEQIEIIIEELEDLKEFMGYGVDE